MAEGIRTPNLPLGSNLVEFLGIETVGTTKSLRRFTRESVIGPIEAVTTSFQAGGGVIFTTKDQANSKLTYGDATMAWVILDPSPANNGVYQKAGGSGSGTWTKLAELPYSFYRALNIGEGTANAIIATNGYPLANKDALIVVNITDDTTSSNVTIALNGGTPLHVKTASGNNPAAGGLIAGMVVAGYIEGDSFRLLSDQASAAIVPAAEAAQAAAEAARDVALGAVPSAFASSRTALKAIDSDTVTAVFLKEADREGQFIFRLGDYSSQIAEDPAEGIYIEADDVSASDGAWVRVYSGAVNIKWFGAKGDGSTDDTPALQAAVAAAVAAGVDLVLGKNETYLLDTWPALGYYPTSKTRIHGVDRTSTLKGPAGGAYFLRPDDVFDISGVKFDRWIGIVRRDTAEGGSITGARFVDNECVNITGIPFNVEIEFKDSYVSRNRFSSCSGGYVIRIGDNTYANQDNWSGNFICQNVLRTITASSTTSLFAILVCGRDTLIDGNDIDGLTSTDGEAVGIYVKLRHSQIVNNKIRNVTSTGSSGAALDVAGISLKGAIRTVTNSGIQGFNVVCANNHIRAIGAQGAKGSGIRCQIARGTVACNLVQDVGVIGISADDSNGTSFNKIINNHIEGYNILGTDGVQLSTFGTGHRVIGNSIVNFARGVSIACGSGSLLSTLVADNSIYSTRPGSAGILFGASGGSITGVMITGNDVDVPGNIVVNSATVSRVNLRNNDFAPATASGAANISGSSTGITFSANP